MTNEQTLPKKKMDLSSLRKKVEAEILARTNAPKPHASPSPSSAPAAPSGSPSHPTSSSDKSSGHGQNIPPPPPSLESLLSPQRETLQKARYPHVPVVSTGSFLREDDALPLDASITVSKASRFPDLKFPEASEPLELLPEWVIHSSSLAL